MIKDGYNTNLSNNRRRSKPKPHHAHADDRNGPGQTGVNAHPVQDETGRGQNGSGEQQRQTVFGLANAAVASGNENDEPVAEVAGVESAYEAAD